MFPLSFYGEKKVHIRELSPMSLIHLFFYSFTIFAVHSIANPYNSKQKQREKDIQQKKDKWVL